MYGQFGHCFEVVKGIPDWDVRNVCAAHREGIVVVRVLGIGQRVHPHTGPQGDRRDIVIAPPVDGADQVGDLGGLHPAIVEALVRLGQVKEHIGHRCTLYLDSRSRRGTREYDTAILE